MTVVLGKVAASTIRLKETSAYALGTANTPVREIAAPIRYANNAYPSEPMPLAIPKLMRIPLFMPATPSEFTSACSVCTRIASADSDSTATYRSS